MDFFGTGLLGSVLGGIFRLIPEVLKLFDRVNERKHELEMFKLQSDVEKMRGQFRVEERYVDHSVTQLDAIREAFKEQAEAAGKSYPWVAAASALVRPVVTYFLFGFYCAVKATVIVYAMVDGASWRDIVGQYWTVDDFGLLMMILTFWFVGRPIEKYTRQ